MIVSPTDRRVLWALLAAGGPALLGIAIGLPMGLRSALSLSWQVPLVAAGTMVLMTPALYIAISLVQAAPPAIRVTQAVAKGLLAYGTLVAGVAPAIAFVGATSESAAPACVGGVLAAGGGALAGLRTLRRGLDFAPEVRTRGFLVFSAWAGVALALGGHLLVRAVFA